MIAFVAAQLGVTGAVAGAIVNVVSKAGTLITIISIIGGIASAGASAILSMGWATFKSTVKNIILKKGKAKAIAW